MKILKVPISSVVPWDKNPEGHKMPTRLATLEANYLTSSKAIDDMRRENREDHGKIFDAINGLRAGK